MLPKFYLYLLGGWDDGHFSIVHHFLTVFFAHLQLTVIHPQLPQEQPAKGSSKVDIQLQAKDSHLKIGVHGVEQPLYNLASEVAGSSQNFFANGAKEQSRLSFIYYLFLKKNVHTYVFQKLFCKKNSSKNLSN